MAWNPYTDQKNRAYSGILTALFPEQTKTIPRILVWSVVFLADLILGAYGAYRLGWLTDTNFSKLRILLIGGAVLLIFWLQGFLWYGIANRIRKSRELG